MSLTQDKVAAIIDLIREWYPDWQNSQDPNFQEDEVLYKRDAMEKAQGFIGRQQLDELLRQEDYTEFIARLDKAGHTANLLFLSTPSTGDLRVMHQDGLDQPGFCRAVYDLMYGSGTGAERLQRYVDYVVEQGLPNYWTFPTYFLYFCHPDAEIFVKPGVTKCFLEIVDESAQWNTVPSGESYQAIKQVASDVLTAFETYGARDMVDAQSILWTAARVELDKLVTAEKRDEFRDLYSRFLDEYPQTRDGRYHIDGYGSVRQTAQANYTEICAAADRGEDTTDAVLLKLLPYADNQRNRDAGAWIHLAPTINGDIRKWYERSGWTRPEDWPKIASAILQFVRRCVDTPDELKQACTDFSALPYSKGFQTGTLTPILNALQPEAFTLINNKSRAALNYFADKKFGQNLEDYPAENTTIRQLIEELDDALNEGSGLGLSPGDLFDMFSHWLVAVDKYDFRNARYWKIATGEKGWQFDDWVGGGFVAIGWDELGDLSEFSRADFGVAVDRAKKQSGWTKQALEQVWKFAKQIGEGDQIVANRGTTELLGIGTVVGPYYFVPGAKQAHRLPVEWDDTTHRRINEGGWRKTLIEIDQQKFLSLLESPPIERGLAKPFSDLFADYAEADWAFDFLRRSFDLLGIDTPKDLRCAITIPKNDEGNVLRVNVGMWLVIDFRGPESSTGKRVHLSMLAEGLDPIQYPPPTSTFAKETNAGPVGGYGLPYEALCPMAPDLQAHYERSFAAMGEMFAGRGQTPFRHAHQQAIMEALFDMEKRRDLLTNGLPEWVAPGKQAPPTQTPLHPNCPFSMQAFELLMELDDNPTKDFYDANKIAIQQEVEEPFKRVMRQVADRLPLAVRDVMETQKRIFARFLKNDFGQGGAWPFYWGAFYPIGSKRSLDAQLSMWLNCEFLEFGFYIGNYGSAQRERFQRNCERHHVALEQVLESTMSASHILYGDRSTFKVASDGFMTQENLSETTWKDFLGDPSHFDCDVSVALPRNRLLQMAEDELVDYIAHVHTQLFPLVILATEDDPLPAIADYLEAEEPGPTSNIEYSLRQIAEDSGFEEEKLAQWTHAIRRKNQAILYGPPGTGKTYIAEKLAIHLIGGRDGFTELVQFHPAYSYEDFIQGIRPQSRDGRLDYPIVAGRFLEFCRRARQCQGDCVLIIDEINRANLARVFGELMYLLEYRDNSVPLAVSGQLFSIPKNVLIIGTMNTADRSIALVDHALRRRFAFLPLYPDGEVLRRYYCDVDTQIDVDRIIAVLGQINQQIGDRHYQLGISFFIDENIDDNLEGIWRMEIEPYLEEYFFDRADIYQSFCWEHVKEKLMA